ncbi:MAG TPA: RcnB family protein [Oxalicibacterium sp.]|uniref:RcnB family protein n=1 Tax=Oxalicibacterium sp. TaxID=2766525 RepID=UPI002C2757E6|nr:RcnB family protein [Oxalicibacterium sp.]HWU98817.1 RcnB family protein [Oxalicibacterium sp.]
MKNKLIAAAIIAAAFAAQGSAFADDHDHDHRGPHHDNRHHRDYHHASRHDSRHDFRHDYRHDGRGAGPRHDFYRGQRLAPEYRRHEYVVDNWRGHHLKAPPRGYHWVQTGPDYVLVAITTGIIAQIVLSN